MSNFACEHCGRIQIDRDGVGYVAGCSHYPPETKRKVYRVRFSDDDKPTRAFYDGVAWYRSERSRVRRLSVHPVSWEEDEGMSEAKLPPTPWKIECDEARGRPRCLIVDKDGNEVLAVNPNREQWNEVAELCADAPALLNALRNVMKIAGRLLSSEWQDERDYHRAAELLRKHGG